MIVLDASALLAFLFREPGAELVAEVTERCCLSTVNLCEVLGRFARDGHDPIQVVKRIRETAIEIVLFDPNQAALAAALVPTLQPKGLSLGDRACLALAASRGLPAMTADRAWADLDVGVEIQIIR